MTMRLDALFVNGRIHTGDEAHPEAHAIGVAGEHIVGLDDDVIDLAAQRVFDLGGRRVVPGFNDVHFHLSMLGQALQRCDLRPSAAPTLDDLYRRIAEFASGLPADAWVLGEGFHDQHLGAMPHRQGLDVAAAGRPVWIIHASHHAGVASTAALARMGFSDLAGVPDIPGGVVGRDADGAANGYLAEAAVTRMGEAVRPRPFEEFIDAIGRGSDRALSWGLTSVTEPGIGGTLTGNGPDDIAAFQVARDRGRLRVRTTVMPEMRALKAFAGDDRRGFDLGVRSGLGDDHVRIGAVKLFSDGAISARTAAMRSDYVDPVDAGSGMLFGDAASLAVDIIGAHLAGWQVATHAIGDRAVDVVLDAYEQAQRIARRPDARHRIEHCGLADDVQVQRLVAGGVIPVPQARFLPEFGTTYLRAMGADRALNLYRQRGFLDAGIVVPGSSDCPVVDGSPLLGIAAMVTRRIADGSVHSPHERLTVREALRAFTHGSAFAEHAEGRKGTLRRGMLADFAVLSDDLLACEPDAIEHIRVEATVVGGLVEYGEL